MRFAALCGNGLIKNSIFDTASPENRDNCFAPYALLKEKFHVSDIQIDTVDESQGRTLAFELHQDVQHGTKTIISYLLMFETEFVKIENGDAAEWSKYRKIFTWNDDLIDGDRFVKINFPNPIQVHPIDGFANRNQFCCLISSNKALYVRDDRDLYPERVKVIRWFEMHAPNDFDLYGVGWDVPMVRGNLLGKLERRFWRALGRMVKLHPFPSFRGKVAHKRDVLMKTRFAICYENVRDLPGYITEKIFDCFFSGCVPVYWGASNITDHIPADCFIDRRQFRDTCEVYNFLKAMTEQEFIGYQQRIAAFLQSDAAYPFGSEFFAETIVTTIVQDIGA
ncbi:MAG: hypothetical protein HOP20_07725 [Sulfuriferula sp.]|nr:hypothetical protein [Sulfuriferula sp.]